MAMIDGTEANLGLAYLRFLGPEKWHCFAAEWNWDDGVEQLDWIARQPDCERATAQLIFWRGSPDFYLPGKGSEPDDGEARERNSDVFRMLKVIAQNWTSGFYTSSRLSGIIYNGEHEGQSWFEYPLTGEIFGTKSILGAQRPEGGNPESTKVNLKGIFAPLSDTVVLSEMLQYREREQGCEPYRLPWSIPDSIGQILSGDPVDGRDFDLSAPPPDEFLAQWNKRENAQ